MRRLINRDRLGWRWFEAAGIRCGGVFSPDLVFRFGIQQRHCDAGGGDGGGFGS